MAQISQNSINGHRWSTGGKPLNTDEKIQATGRNWQFSKLSLGMWHIQMPKKEKIKCNVAGNFSILRIPEKQLRNQKCQAPSKLKIWMSD